MYWISKLKHIIKKKFKKSKYFLVLKKIDHFFFEQNSIYNLIQQVIINIQTKPFFVFWVFKIWKL